eukprot:UN17559
MSEGLLGRSARAKRAKILIGICLGAYTPRRKSPLTRGFVSSQRAPLGLLPLRGALGGPSG